MTEQVLSEHEPAPATYLWVLVALLVMTAMSVSLSFAPVAGVWHIVFDLTFAVSKGSLVILFFMHVLHSKPLTWLAVGFAFVWLGILLVLTLSDYFSRGLMPYPGH